MSELFELEARISQLIVDSLALEDVDPGDIDPTAPLFGEGLGLDSIDALELGLVLRKEFKIQIDAKTDDVRLIFSSVRHLAAFVYKQSGAV